MITKSDTSIIEDALTPLDLEARLVWLASRFAEMGAFSSSLGIEDQVISHILFSKALPLRVFTIDTGRLFEESQSLLSLTRERYGATIEVFTPNSDNLQNYLNAHGPNAFYQSVDLRLACCHIRKVEPLKRALQGSEAWITGLRGGQSANRAGIPVAQWDPDHSLVKVNPLFDWDELSIKEYVHTHNIPINRLHGKGFPSIGCAPCTRAVAPGDNPRAGRWWWENPNKKECGLHLHSGENFSA